MNFDVLSVKAKAVLICSKCTFKRIPIGFYRKKRNQVQPGVGNNVRIVWIFWKNSVKLYNFGLKYSQLLFTDYEIRGSYYIHIFFVVDFTLNTVLSKHLYKHMSCGGKPIRFQELSKKNKMDKLSCTNFVFPLDNKPLESLFFVLKRQKVICLDIWIYATFIPFLRMHFIAFRMIKIAINFIIKKPVW